MHFSNIILSLATFYYASQAVAAPTNELLKRDDSDDAPVVVHLKTTVHNIETQTHVVLGQASTYTNWVVDTSTATVTSFTATVTKTVFGTPMTYTTVASTPIDKGAAVQSKAPTANTDTAETTTSSTLATTTATTSTPTQKDAATTAQTASTSDQTVSAAPTVTPTLTDISNIPSSTANWIIENVVTSVASSVCYVDYDYYLTDDPVETVTSTLTIYSTVTRS